MSHTSREQSGFSFVEVLLVLFVVAILAFGGWFIWHNQQTKNKVVSATTYSKQKVTKTTTRTLQTLDIKQWGVEATVPAALGMVTYTIDANGNNLILTSALQTTLIPNDVYCSTAKSPWGIYRSGSVGPSATADTSDWLQIAGVWYERSWPQAGCDASVSTASSEQINTSYTTLFHSLVTDQ